MTNNSPRGANSNPLLLRVVDGLETYGVSVIPRYFQKLHGVSTVLDLGAGSGRDLGFAREAFPDAALHAVECRAQHIAGFAAKGIAAHSLNIEADALPFADASVDLIIANQILEHTKELFWIFHEMTRVLKVGGHLAIGVPNVASLHNRIGLLFGKHPTQAKACSAHVRCFSKNDFLLFLQEAFPSGYALESFDGSQFYPFPRVLARPLAKALPSMAFSIFFLLRKAKEYDRSFLDYPVLAALATNYKTD